MKFDHKIFLMGGLGNQLYQYNFGCYLESRGFKVVYSTLLLKKNFITKILSWTIHDFVLEKLLNKNISIDNNFFDFIYILFSKINFFNSLTSFYGVSKVPVNPSKYIFGYFQNKDFLKKIHFEIPNVNKKNKIVTVHMRLGDSPSIKQDLLFQTNTIENLQTNEVIVVTNDIFLAKSYMLEKFDNIICSFYSEDVVSDFIFLSTSETVICSNSTFSWWACKISNFQKNVFIPQSLSSRLGNIYE